MLRVACVCLSNLRDNVKIRSLIIRSCAWEAGGNRLANDVKINTASKENRQLLAVYVVGDTSCIAGHLV